MTATATSPSNTRKKSRRAPSRAKATATCFNALTEISEALASAVTMGYAIDFNFEHGPNIGEVEIYLSIVRPTTAPRDNAHGSR